LSRRSRYGYGGDLRYHPQWCPQELELRLGRHRCLLLLLHTHLQLPHRSIFGRGLLIQPDEPDASSAPTTTFLNLIAWVLVWDSMFSACLVLVLSVDVGGGGGGLYCSRT